MVVQVSKNAHGTHGFAEWLMKYHGRPLTVPLEPGDYPLPTHVKWHVSEVFKGPARFV